MAREDETEDSLLGERTRERGFAGGERGLAAEHLDVPGDQVQVAARGNQLPLEDVMSVGQSRLTLHVVGRNDQDPMTACNCPDADRMDEATQLRMPPGATCRKNHAVIAARPAEADRGDRVFPESGSREQKTEFLIETEARGTVDRREHGCLVAEAFGVGTATPRLPAERKQGPGAPAWDRTT
ncbi:hypothetical protein ABEV34_18885 [Methylorubrum rhodesianum]|uniref:hypothetical protein n=1 Tax=Methylorubrum rhodesianum TaxID=29427 RepID=UPI003D2B6F5A